MPQNLAF